jgi:hypothetical protein
MTKIRPSVSEFAESKTFMDWCRLKGLPIIHIANERFCSPFYGRKLKELGVKRGFPDYFLPIAKHNYYGLMIEMKRKKVFKISEAQATWLSYLEEQGYATAICFGFDDAVNIIEGYMNDIKTFTMPDIGPHLCDIPVYRELLL